MTKSWINVLPGHAPNSTVFGVVRNCLEIINDVDWKANNISVELRKARQACFNRVNKYALDEQVARVCISVICDLRGQGWTFTATGEGILGCKPALDNPTKEEEKARIRAGFLIERDSQLQATPVIKFVERMEQQRLGPNGWTSIFSLMRDGRELADKLKVAASLPEGKQRDEVLRNIIDPYIQVVDEGRCEYTQLELKEIWRYFRYTWVNPYNSVPGRNIWFLIRDRAAQNHPVIGIAALGSSIVQMTDRDKWIGWDSKTFIRYLRQNSDQKWAKWIEQSYQQLLNGIYIQDFLADDVISETDLINPQIEVIDRLLKLAQEAKEGHRLFPKVEEHKRGKVKTTQWMKKAQTLLFRSKRATTLANLLQAKRSLLEAGFEESNPVSLQCTLQNRLGRSAIAEILRQVKSAHVGVNMMDLIVCGAVAPYNQILGGKLVSLLMTSPEVVQAYYNRYQTMPSIIASSMAGKPVIREPNLVMLGTTSLYGVGSSQYNRLRLPVRAVGGQTDKEIRYFKVGLTLGFGSYHFSRETLEEIEAFLAQKGDARRVNSIFGEGVNPRLRKVRDALATAGLSSELLLQHGNRRLIYGIPLASNFREILMGLEETPDYILPNDKPAEITCRIAGFWRERWLSHRIENNRVLEEVSKQSLLYPITHGARVRIPNPVVQLSLFDDL